ncbi:MAG TPA: phenylalanine--tRNA ligase subunit alpha [Solirubrobacterales bacterium]|nr:phenylalanine--tRNA ligase subunit alpha [Solirubrobacterales bacterium]
MLDRIEELKAEAEAAIAAAPGAGELEELRVAYLGRKSELTSILRGIGDLDPTERGPVGAAANAVRQALEGALTARRSELEAAELERSLLDDVIDVTLPGTPPVATGHLHLLTRTRREIEDVFVGLGYRVMEGPDVEHDYYNFTALNHPPGHPARMVQDSFYVDPKSLAEGIRVPAWAVARDPAAPGREAEEAAGPDALLPPGPRDVLLRTHTSPMQIRAMESQPPPIFIVVPGTAYRRDTIDATHSPMFHQVEGLAVGDGVSLADLAGTLQEAARALFGPDRETRLKPDFFPFTEPSVQVDVSCMVCGGSGRVDGGERDPVCKGTGWIEILGAGMVDPNVFGFVERSGYDPQTVQGFAFGMGIERIAMLKHGVPDLRMYYENDLRFLGQF